MRRYMVLIVSRVCQLCLVWFGLVCGMFYLSSSALLYRHSLSITHTSWENGGGDGETTSTTPTT